MIPAVLRNARGQALLSNIDKKFQNPSRHAPTLRVAADLIAQSAGPGHQEHHGRIEKRKQNNHNWKRDKRHRQMEKRKSIKSKWTSGKRTSTRKARKRHQNGTQEPKIGPKKAVNGTTRGQKWSQEGPKRVPKRSQTASRTKKRTKTTPRPPWDPPRGRLADISLTSRGPFGRPKMTQNGA